MGGPGVARSKLSLAVRGKRRYASVAPTLRAFLFAAVEKVLADVGATTDTPMPQH
jgi:hypothetical protein